MTEYHTSVLLQQTIDGLHIQKGKVYIDATLGGGGHTAEIMRLGGRVLGIDQDEDAIAFVKKELQPQGELQKNLTIVLGNFENIEAIAKENGFETVSGILFDLGISSHHIDEGSRGFSFLKDAPLDMRMNTYMSVSAADLVNGLNKGELIELFTKYGEEIFAKRCAQAIIQARKKKRIETTTELARIIVSVYPGRNHKVHPATKVFQALRIAVNDELYVLKQALPQALRLLEKNGRIAIIAFHSLEDRIAKETFLSWEKQGFGHMVTKKPIVPSKKEIEENKRARSSKLRIFEKI